MLFLMAVALVLGATPIVAAKKSRCDVCLAAVEGFEKNMKRTEGKDWCGGDTKWHEEKCLVYAKSETRLAEVMETVCEEKNNECNEFVSDYEEQLEEWYFKHTDKPLRDYICVDTAEACCPLGKFGKKCEDCPGGNPPCSGHGKCDGDGTRGGSGKCTCDGGYTGDVCQECAGGYVREGGECKDIDECAASPSPCSEDERCQNNLGSFTCDCKEGYERNSESKCTLIPPPPPPPPTEPEHSVDSRSAENNEGGKGEDKEEDCGMVGKALGMFGMGSCAKKTMGNEGEGESKAAEAPVS
eukprot:comp20394_c0_seq1/m.25798 comp20394_c0_seq1/g.25798  ORF comp20394_c0_seq1/g.25798 comp20394_c0_seq1/m.25798 type:complete len:298 (-) comp20394_c0_seq1:196-1089(-)